MVRDTQAPCHRSLMFELVRGFKTWLENGREGRIEEPIGSARS